MTQAIYIEEEAARWLLRVEEGRLSADEQSAFDVWITIPEHQAAYWRLEHGWRQADRVRALGKGIRLSRQPVKTPRFASRQAVAGLAACLLLGIGATVAVSWQAFSGNEKYRTPVGTRQSVPLADGSVVSMNTQTSMRAEVSDEHREVWLDKGEAFFEVAHDPEHPFVVHAGKARVTVLGTKFSVRRQGESVKVSVLEGRVRVAGIAPAKARVMPVELTGGHVVIADANSVLLSKMSVEKLSDELSWRQGRLTFDQTPLSEVVAEFNRYNKRQLSISDPSVAAMRISGSFDATNLDEFIFLLKQGLGLKVDENENNVTIFA